MLKLAKLTLLATGVAMTSASTRPILPAQPLLIAPLAIIEGGTVTTLPKGLKARNGKVVVLRARGDAKPRAKPGKPAATPVRARDTAREPVRSCACTTGGSSDDVIEVRNTDQGLKVMIIGPDGSMRTRVVAAAPGVTARHD